MRIVAMSDLHGHLPKPEDVPECDVICICGDIVPLDYQDDDVKSIAWFCLEFVPWTDALKCKKVLFIAGNHDFWLEHLNYKPYKLDETRKQRSASEILKKLLPGTNKGMHKIVYLRDSSFEFEGKRFYGTPWISDLPKWAFNKSEEELESKEYAQIPSRLDVLLTHMPTSMCEMGTVLQKGWNCGTNYGSSVLSEILMQRNIKYTFCGHVHSGNHVLQEYKPGCNIVNVSIKDEDYVVRTYYFNVYDI